MRRGAHWYRRRMVKWLDEVIGAVDEKELRRYHENLRHL